jgi:arsenate reductase
MDAEPKIKVLFLSTSNSVRSQMADALLRKHAGDRFEVHSAGVELRPLEPMTLQVLEEAGVDTSDLRSKSTQEYLGHINFGYLIIVGKDSEEKCPTTFLGVSNRMNWPFDDPSKEEGSDETKLDHFRRVRDQIDARIREWLAELDTPKQTESAAASS